MTLPTSPHYDARVGVARPEPVPEDHRCCARCGVFDAPYLVPDRRGEWWPVCGLCCDVLTGRLPAVLARAA